MVEFHVYTGSSYIRIEHPEVPMYNNKIDVSEIVEICRAGDAPWCTRGDLIRVVQPSRPDVLFIVTPHAHFSGIQIDDSDDTISILMRISRSARRELVNQLLSGKKL